MRPLSASPPIEAPGRPVGRRTVAWTDPQRERTLTVDVWYPAREASSLTRYEPIPGIAFESANAHDGAPVEPGSYPVIVLSHGRTGMRFAYALLSEALAARGAIVVAPDHAGDVMTDWLGGTFVDDRTNEVNRVGDSGFVLDVMLGAALVGRSGLDPVLLASVDASRIAAIGHSYGAYTALAAAAGVRGVAPDQRIGAVVGLQPYTRSMSDTALARVHTPTLLVLSEFDTTAPVATDGERPWALIQASPTWRLDLLATAHHASSDMGLYLELAGSIPDLPPMVAAYVTMMTPDMIAEHLRPWREGLQIQVRAIWAFLDVTLAMHEARGVAEADQVEVTPGVILQRR
ncbi:MAG: Alpha/beta hydrolase family [Ilumatobacteraceae bacterium]|nr:Alpha/beta hydrolase family [Ilumatobacteraceae bacterium]